jgi:tetratricopeptide (TPR) repeat protein
MLTALLLTVALLPAPDKLADAREHLAAGRSAEAAALLATMLTAGEGDAREVRLLLADAQLAGGAPDRALETLEPVALDGDAPALRKMGEAFRANGDRLTALGGQRAGDAGYMYEQAADFLGRAGDAGDAAAGAQAGLIELYTLGLADAARARAERLLKRNAGDGEALLLRGSVGVNASWDAAQSGDSDKAKALRAEAIKDIEAADKALGGKRPEPAFQLAWLHEQDDAPEKAVKAAADWCDRLPQKDFSRLYQLARRYAAERRYAPAAEALLQMVRRDAALLTAWVKQETAITQVAVELGWSAGSLYQSRPQQAKDVWSALCAAEPRDADIFNNLGLVARDLGAFEESWRAYEKALALQPDNANLLNDGAVILHYYLHRDYDKCQEMYERAIEIATAALEQPDSLTPEQKAAAEKAKTEATDNMANLAKGIHEWGR